nr:MORN repeat containing protein [Marseillevirus futianmevirus]
MEYFIKDKKTLCSFWIAEGVPCTDESLKLSFCRKEGHSDAMWYILPNGKRHGKETGETFRGIIRYELEFRDGERHGAHRLWKNKKLDYEAEYKNGEQDGPQTCYFLQSGTPRCSVEWKNGKMHGMSLVKRRDGSLRSCFWYFQGQKHGPEFFWNREGILTKRITWSDGEKHGVEKSVNKKGYETKKIWKGGSGGKKYAEKVQGSCKGLCLEAELKDFPEMGGRWLREHRFSERFPFDGTVWCLCGRETCVDSSSRREQEASSFADKGYEYSEPREEHFSSNL